MTESTLKPFAKGDVFAGCTVLDNPADDHAGRGRIIQYDARLKERGVLWLDPTTHLVGGLRFDSRGVLWAFDMHAFLVLNIHPDGRVRVRDDFPPRAFSHVNFARDGSLYLAEHVVGDAIRPEIAARMHTKIPFFPGGDRFGDGHVWHFSAEGRLLGEHATQTHGGMGGFLGVTMSALAPDGRTLVYCSETGPRLMRYDLAADRQLPDLQSFQPPFQGPPEMFFAMAYAPDGTLYVLRGGRIDVVSDAGETTRSIPLNGFGWATVDITADGRFMYVGNFFSGEILKLALPGGKQVAKVDTGQPRALAGIASYAGAPARRKAPSRSRPKPARRKPAPKRKSARKSRPIRKAKVARKVKKAARKPVRRVKRTARRKK
jgi:hypothetical protein